MTSALVLGCGSIGSRHARNLAELGVHVFTFDVRSSVAVSVAAEAGGLAVAHRDAAPDVDAVVVATPSVDHVADLAWGLERGAHVFVEKPLGTSMADVNRARELAVRHADRRVMVGCNLRFTDGYRALHATLDDIGHPITVLAEFGWYLPCWRPDTDYRSSYSARRDLGGGIVLDAIHEIDYVIDLAGGVVDVAAQCTTSGALEVDVEDTAEIILRHQRGNVSHIHLDYLQPDYTRWCKVVAGNGSAFWDFAAGSLRVCREPGAGWTTLLEAADTDRNEMYLRELRAFLDAVRDDAPVVNDLVAAADVLEVALQARTQGGVE
jgi:predicted dehydrogenase